MIFVFLNRKYIGFAHIDDDISLPKTRQIHDMKGST